MSHLCVTKSRRSRTRLAFVQPPVFQYPSRSMRRAYASAWRRGCGLQSFGLCANLTFCDERVAQQAVSRIALQLTVNQPENIALERAERPSNLAANRLVPLNSEVGSCHPHTFPQDRSVSGSDFCYRKPTFEDPQMGGRFADYPAGSLLPSSILAKRVELCRNAR